VAVIIPPVEEEGVRLARVEASLLNSITEEVTVEVDVDALVNVEVLMSI
jgi:hypothetical protein